MNTCNFISQLISQQDDIIKKCENNVIIAVDDFKPLFIKQKKMFISLQSILTTTLDFLSNKMNKEKYNELMVNMMNEYNIILFEYLEVLNQLVQINMINENQYIEYCNDTKKEKGLMDMVLHICTMLKT